MNNKILPVACEEGNKLHRSLIFQPTKKNPAVTNTIDNSLDVENLYWHTHGSLLWQL